MIRFHNDKDIYALDDIFLEKIMDREEYRGLYDRMFDGRNKPISVFNKGICGNGGTTGFINYVLNSCKNGTGKGCLILVPNVSIVTDKEDKLKDNDNVCFVYGGVKDINVDAQVVIATYDQFPRLMKKLHNAAVKTEGLEMKFWSGRTIIIDEYHKLVTESSFRKICVAITELIRNVDSPVILMSATPYMEYVEMLSELLPDRELAKYNVIYPYNMRSGLTVYDIKEDRLLPVFKKMMESTKKDHICVFYNCVNDIKNLAIQLGEDCEVLCSSAKKDRLRELYSNKFNQDKKVHFLTSAFFTGCDIEIPEDKTVEVVIVGSPEFDFMALNEMDVKQILGRFRSKTGNVRYYGNNVFYMNKYVDPATYNQNKTDYDLKTILLNSPNFDWKTATGGIDVKQSHIRLKKVLDTYNMWSSCDTLIQGLSAYGFDVEKGDPTAINELDKVKRKKQLPFKKVKEMVKKGLPVTIFQYKDIEELIEFVKVFGTGRDFDRLTKVRLNNWYKVHMLIEGVELEGMTKEMLMEAFDLGDHRIYSARYLLECLSYLCDGCDYDNLAWKMMEVFGVTAVDMEFYSKKRYKNRYVLVSGKNDKKCPPKLDTSLKEKDKKADILRQFPGHQNTGMIPYINFSYETEIMDHHSRAYSKKMESILAEGWMKSLASKKDYQWMMEDKRSRLPVIKADNDRVKALKIYGQTKMSEMYTDSTAQYEFSKKNVDRVDCLVVDLDDGLPFSEFREMYCEWKWYAMPTFSNVDEDWKKFRVIIPLKYTIYLGKGENNLKVLKCLRKLFCPFEDPQHQMYFQANLEDYQKTYINKGELYDITQDTVDSLHKYIDNCYEFKQDRLDVEKVETKLSGFKIRRCRTWEMDDAIKYCMENNKEGFRHTALFVIKNNIKSEHLDEFGQWYLEYAGKRRYDKHWLGNSLID